VVPLTDADRSPARLPRGPDRLVRLLESRRGLALLCVAVWLVAVVVNLGLAGRAGPLGGEEVTATFLNPVLTLQRLQCNQFTSNTGSSLFFAALRPLLYPHLGTNWLRDAKAVFCALVPVLLLLISRRRLGISLGASVAVGLLAAVTPALFAFSWIALEIGADLVPGLLAIYVATSAITSGRTLTATSIATRSLIIGGIGGVAASFYGGSLAFVVGCVLAPWLWSVSGATLVARVARRTMASAMVLVAGAAVVLLTSFFLINSHYILLGGGTQAARTPFINIGVLLGDLFGGERSYYYVSKNGGVSLIALVAAAVGAIAGRHNRVVQLLCVIALASIAAAVMSAPPAGTRRVLPAVCVIVLLNGVALDWVRCQRGRAGLGLACAVTAVTLVVGGGAVVTDSRAMALAQLRLSRDYYTFTTIPGQTDEQTISTVDASFPALADPARYEPDRLAAWIIVERDARGAETSDVWQWWSTHHIACALPPGPIG
jgi:hypothetical protein